MNCERRAIDLPHAGESFCDSTPEALKARLLYLRSVGYRFPDRVFADLEEWTKESEGSK